MTQKGSDVASCSESGSEAETESQGVSKSGSKEGRGCGGGGESEDGSSQYGDSGSEVEESCREAEESGSKSGSSSSESEAVTKKAQPERKTSKPDPNTSQPILLPELDSKDSKEEWKTNHHGFACHMDTDFSVWRDKKISKGLKQWYEWDKMTCNHIDPCKEVKYPDPLGAPLDYMENCDVFKPIKTSEYDLYHFYQVGLTGVP